MVLKFAHDSVHEIFVRNIWVVLSKVADGRTDRCHALGLHRVLENGLFFLNNQKPQFRIRGNRF